MGQLRRCVQDGRYRRSSNFYTEGEAEPIVVERPDVVADVGDLENGFGVEAAGNACVKFALHPNAGMEVEIDLFGNIRSENVFPL